MWEKLFSTDCKSAYSVIEGNWICQSACFLVQLYADGDLWCEIGKMNLVVVRLKTDLINKKRQLFFFRNLVVFF